MEANILDVLGLIVLIAGYASIKLVACRVVKEHYEEDPGDVYD
jgi:hypothetical protein